MDAEGLAGVIRGFPFQEDENFLFVSYSHKDEARVYPVVLEWLRRGCNVYIDTQFGLHTSDKNWTALMTRALTSPHCRLAACFVSPYYAYSDAALLEVLTIRMEKERRQAGGDDLAVDYILLDRIESGDVPQELREQYEADFLQKEKWQSYVSFSDYLRDAGGGNILSEGLRCVFGPDDQRWRKALDAAFRRGWERFYPTHAQLMEEALSAFHGNYHKPNEDISVQLQRIQKAGIACQTDPQKSTEAPAPVSPTETGMRPMGRNDLRGKYLLGCYCCDKSADSASFNAGVFLLSQASEGGFIPASAELVDRLSQISSTLTSEAWNILSKAAERLESVPEDDKDYPAICWLLWVRWSERRSTYALERLLKASERHNYAPGLYEAAKHCRLLKTRLGKTWKQAQRSFYQRAAESPPDPWTTQEASDKSALYRTGRITATPTHAAKVAEYAAKAREILGG